MCRDLEHPDITMALATGYPRRMQKHLRDEDDEYTKEDAYYDYCDRCYEESRDRERFGID